ncbi:kinase-like domain-containing protein [Halteromyces radiatus]|uniref:kinase-like domain-containing protein n=1 Tax=Halteromyces radiatus TaxID=101107 RepID=UPI002220D0E0|nr:kinase-like domain-containing protein [Halteromyces radiatus]KAI8076767.1 kinase-like domain-containing protein [Halteromyces radiatus]
MNTEDHRPSSILSFWSDKTVVDQDLTETTDHHSSSVFDLTTTNHHHHRRRQCLIVKHITRRQSETHRAFLKRVSNEYCITSVLSHQNVVGSLDLLMENYRFCMVMNLTEMGDPLLSLIRTGSAFNSKVVKKYIRQLGQAVHYIHTLGIAHRDIRPSNLLVMPDGVLKLTGFHDAHVFQSPSQHHRLKSQGKCGELPYQSPEVLFWWDHDHTSSSSVKKKKNTCQQMSSLSHTDDDHLFYWATALDIWSIGINLLYFIRGEIPWSVACIHHSARYSDYILHRQSSIMPPLPHSFEHFLHRILDPDPSSRMNIEQLINDPWLMMP